MHLSDLAHETPAGCKYRANARGCEEGADAAAPEEPGARPLDVESTAESAAVAASGRVSEARVLP